MEDLTRRSVLRTSLGWAAAGSIARPYVANAAAKTATIWWVQGFAQEEDVAIKKVVAEYEKASGNTIDYSIVPYAPHRQKVVSAMTSGDVPDYYPPILPKMAALYAWQGKLVDVSDVVETQKAQYSDTALLSAQLLQQADQAAELLRRAVYRRDAAVPHLEVAGREGGLQDWPTSQRPGMPSGIFSRRAEKTARPRDARMSMGSGCRSPTNGVDPNTLFNYFLIAYGGKDIVTKDGKLHLDDPQVKDAVIKALTYPTTAYKEGYVPSGAINWNDADDNNAFHSKQIVMDLDGTISTEVAMIADKEDYDDIVTMGLPLSNDGKPVPAQLTVVDAPDP